VKKKKKKKKDSTPTEDTGAADSGGERDQEWERGDEEEDGARASAEDADDFPPGEFSSQPRNPTPKKKKVRDQDAEPAQQKTKKPKKKAAPAPAQDMEDDEGTSSKPMVDKKKKAVRDEPEESAASTLAAGDSRVEDEDDATPKKRKRKSKKGPKDKDPDKPRKPMGAFFRFLADHRAEIIAGTPGLAVTEVNKIGGQKWREASAEVRDKYNQMANEAMEVHKRDLAKYNATLPSHSEADAADAEPDDDDAPPKKRRKSKSDRDESKPRRPSSSYFLFMHAEDEGASMYQKIKSEHPDMVHKEILQEVSKRWSEMSADEKRYWDDQYKALKAHYNDEMQKYYDTHPDAKSANKPPKIGKVKKEDPFADRPKKPRNSFLLFLEKRRPELKAEHSSWPGKDIMSELSQEWSGMSVAQKEVYVTMYREEKKKYHELIVKYCVDHPGFKLKPDPIEQVFPRPPEFKSARAMFIAEQMKKIPENTVEKEWRKEVVEKFKSLNVHDKATWAKKKADRDAEHVRKWCKVLRELSPDQLARHMLDVFEQAHRFKVSPYLQLSVAKEDAQIDSVLEEYQVDEVADSDDSSRMGVMMFPIGERDGETVYERPQPGLGKLLAKDPEIYGQVLTRVRNRPSSKWTDAKEVHKWVVYASGKDDSKTYMFNGNHYKKLNKSWKRWNTSLSSEPISKQSIALPCEEEVHVEWGKKAHASHYVKIEYTTLIKGCDERQQKVYAWPSS